MKQFCGNGDILTHEYSSWKFLEWDVYFLCSLGDFKRNKQYCIGFAILDMNPPWVYTNSQSWIPLPPPTPYHLSGSSPCTSPKHLVSCIEPRLAIRFLHESIHVSMPFSQIIPPSPSPIESKSLFFTSVSLLLSRMQGHHYHLLLYALVSWWRGMWDLSSLIGN